MDVKPTSSLPSTSTAETVEVEPVAFSSSLREFEDHSQVIILKGKLEIQPISSPPSTATKLLETGPAASSSPGVDDDNEEAVESPQKTRSQKQKAVTPDFMPLSRKKLKRSRVLHMEDGEQCAAATNQTPHDIKTNRMSRRSFWRKIPKLNPAGDNSGFVDEKSESENDNILVVDEVHKEYCPIHCVAVVIPKGCHSQFPRKPHTPRTPFIFQPFPAPDEDHSFDLLPQSQQNRNYQRIILTALHSQNCAREDCAIDNCAKMKITMAHSEDCEKDYGECPVWFCSTVSWMLGHYYVCRRRMCHLCFPISLAKHIINSNTHPLREHVIRIFLHRLALKQIPMCPGILAVPRTDRSICAKHYRSFNNYYLTNNEDSRVRIEVRQENDLRFHKLCNRRTNNKDIWDMAAYRLMELEEEWMKRLYKALPCVYNFCKGTCLCRSWPPEPDGFDTD